MRGGTVDKKSWKKKQNIKSGVYVLLRSQNQLKNKLVIKRIIVWDLRGGNVGKQIIKLK